MKMHALGDMLNSLDDLSTLGVVFLNKETCEQTFGCSELKQDNWKELEYWIQETLRDNVLIKKQRFEVRNILVMEYPKHYLMIRGEGLSTNLTNYKSLDWLCNN